MVLPPATPPPTAVMQYRLILPIPPEAISQPPNLNECIDETREVAVPVLGKDEMKVDD